MSNRDKVIFLTVFVVILIGISVTLFIRNSAYRGRCEVQEQRIGNLQIETASQEIEIANQEQEIDSLQEEITKQKQAIETLDEKLAGALPYAKAGGNPITLRNNYGNVLNPAWAELVSFLESDSTESILYSYTSFLCGDFAEKLHNNAEAAGIRAGIAIVHFVEGPPHALNVFYTVDRGLIYIDATGGSRWPVCTHNVQTGESRCANKGEDKIAYIEVGEKYGLIPLGLVGTSSGVYLWYLHYEMYVERWEAYNTAVVSYDAEVDAYNDASGGAVYLSEPEHSYFNDWYNKLEAQRQILETQASYLGDYWYEPPGTVDSVEIYWNAIEWIVKDN